MTAHRAGCSGGRLNLVPRLEFMQRARPYLSELSAMAGEAARSDDPAVVSLALSVLDLQPPREFLSESHVATKQGCGSVHRFSGDPGLMVGAAWADEAADRTAIGRAVAALNEFPQRTETFHY